jgi:acyl-CoA thioester hydrolase
LIPFSAPADWVDAAEPEEVKGASMTLWQKVMREPDVLVEAHVRVAFMSGGRVRPIPKPLRAAMQADRMRGSGRHHSE